ncbi:ras-like protein family member 10B [Schistocerca americana]|uniref:ras-like protein family member 10B n=1 Tax=Schistocerca americana TaxID=7009 RepID=UPI001F4F2545|nr:ras-like protein family member 10B [Schistocerca americana]
MLTPSPQLVDDLPGDSQQTPVASPTPPHTLDLGQLWDLFLNPLLSPSSAPPRLDDAEVPMPLAHPNVASQPPLLRRSSCLARKAGSYSLAAGFHLLLQEDVAADQPTVPGYIGPSGGGRPRGDHAARPPSAGADSCLSCVKVALLGASAVGKTSIVRQFVWNEFSDDYSATDRRYAYYPTVVINERLYELKVSDIPVIPYFPINSFYEWADFRFYGLRSANAYVLVFDLCNTESFQYIRSLRDQMWESRDMRHVPVVVVGNKLDALQMHAAAAARRRDIVTLVRKHWKCAYVECSAKYNWRVVAVFKEVTRAVDAALHSAKDATSPMMDNFHGALDRNKCSIL